jgi:synaptobrevin family protein YKT6
MRLLFSCLFKTGSQAAGKEGPVILNAAKELSSFSYFQRSGINEMFTFFSRTFANNKNLAPGARSSVKQQGYQCHMYVSPFGVTAVAFADDEYPARVAFGYLSRLCEIFAEATGGQLPSSKSSSCNSRTPRRQTS